MAPTPPPPLTEITWSGEVEQVVTGDQTARLHKQIVRIHTDPPLSCVRKHLPGGPTRPPVLLVHGFAQNRYTWHTSRRSPSAWLAAQGWDVWNLELRGHGLSREAGAQGAERFADYVQDVLRARHALPGPAFWIGHSLGGAALFGAASEIATQAAEPPLPAPLGVVGIGAIYRFGQANRFVHTLCGLTHRSPWIERLQVRTRLMGVLMGKLYGATDILGYTFPISGWWPGNLEPELLAERLERGFDWTSLKVWREMSRWSATDQFDYDEAWRHTDVPLLVLLGDEDHLVPPDDGRAAHDRSGSTDRTMLILDDWHNDVHWGHLDLTLGKLAPQHVWAPVHAWMAARTPESSP